MLQELRISDFAIIQRVVLPLEPGFNVLSGETGAGKSIIVGALGLLVGERGSADLVRFGAHRATVEGVFDASGSPRALSVIEEQGIRCDDSIVILRREISQSGRGRAWINDSPVTAAALSAVGTQLVTIHGQHEAHQLLDAGSQRVMLDAFSGAAAERERVGELFAMRASTLSEIGRIRAREKDAASRGDFLRHIVKEIRDAGISEGESDSLEQDGRRLQHAEELAATSQRAAELLRDDDAGVLAALARTRKLTDALARIDPPLERLGEALDTAEIALTELARELEAYAADLELDPERLGRINERRDRIFRITRKHGGSETEVARTLRDSEAELALIESSVNDLAVHQQELRRVELQLESAAGRLSELRRVGAAALAEKVNVLLPALGMPEGELHISLQPLAEVGPEGAEGVEYMLRVNAGHDARALAKSASGGELSRVMLAIESALASVARVPTLVFDEVDAGIGGAVALRVGDVLRALADYHQVLVITHLPQIASRAHNHVSVRKADLAGVSTADVEVVTGDARVREIARMLAGNADSKASRKHALELLDAAGANRKSN